GLATPGRAGDNFHTDAFNAWTPENTNTNYPRLQHNEQNFASESSRFLTDASWLSLKNITLGYILPPLVTEKIGLERCRLYIVGDNIAFWSKRIGMDP